MRSLFYALSIAAVVGLAFWAYGEGYETRQTERAVAQLLPRAEGSHHHSAEPVRPHHDVNGLRRESLDKMRAGAGAD